MVFAVVDDEVVGTVQLLRQPLGDDADTLAVAELLFRERPSADEVEVVEAKEVSVTGYG
jgi:hypothetical protein